MMPYLLLFKKVNNLKKKTEYDSAKIEINDLIKKNINKLFLLE